MINNAKKISEKYVMLLYYDKEKSQKYYLFTSNM